MTYENVRQVNFARVIQRAQMGLMRTRSHFRSASSRWRSVLAPGVCVACDQRTRMAFDLCAQCLRCLPWNAHACALCALPLPVATQTAHRERCAACLTKPPLWDRSVAAFAYAPPADAMILRVKYGGSLCDARVLGTLLADRIATTYRDTALPEIITPLPLSWRRLLYRGHNQSALIARYLSRRLHLPVRYDVLRRTRHTRPQTRLSRSARLTNLGGAFRLSRTLPAPRIALVDDVMTTGATVRAATRTLKAAGALEVHVWVVARAS